MRIRSTNKSRSIASLEYHRGTQIRCSLFSILWPGGAEHQHLSLVPRGFRAISATPPIRQTRQAGTLFESMIWRINESLNQGFSESVKQLPQLMPSIDLVASASTIPWCGSAKFLQTKGYTRPRSTQERWSSLLPHSGLLKKKHRSSCLSTNIFHKATEIQHPNIPTSQHPILWTAYDPLHPRPHSWCAWRWSNASCWSAPRAFDKTSDETAELLQLTFGVSFLVFFGGWKIAKFWILADKTEFSHSFAGMWNLKAI